MALLDPRPPRGRTLRRLLGGLLAGAGAMLVLATALAATGVVPLWRPTVPPPPALVEAEATRAAAAPSAAVAAPTEPPTVAHAAPAPPPALPPAERSVEAPALAAPAEPTAEEAAPQPADTAEPSLATSALLPPPPVASPTLLPTRAVSAAPTFPPPATSIALAMLTPTVLPTPDALPTPTPRPTAVPPPPPPGLPVQLVIPRIRVDTPVIELSTTLDARGVPQWETVPFMAGHYRVTGLAGARTNVVVSGHVRTRDLGNVFRDLHLLHPGDPIVVFTEQGEFTYRVAELRLVPPSDTSPLAPSPQPRLTLITCAGEFDFRAQSFTERLIVAADLVT